MNREKTSRTPGSRAVSRGKLIAVSALFLGPLIAALVWYYGLNAGNAPLGEANHAPLITPPVPLENFENPIYAGGSVSGTGLPRKWRIVHILGDGCGEACGKALYNTRQVRLAVGKDAGRVQRLIVAGSMQVAQEIADNHPDAALPGTGRKRHRDADPAGETALRPGRPRCFSGRSPGKPDDGHTA